MVCAVCHVYAHVARSRLPHCLGSDHIRPSVPASKFGYCHNEEWELRYWTLQFPFQDSDTATAEVDTLLEQLSSLQFPFQDSDTATEDRPSSRRTSGGPFSSRCKDSDTATCHGDRSQSTLWQDLQFPFSRFRYCHGETAATAAARYALQFPPRLTVYQKTPDFPSVPVSRFRYCHGTGRRRTRSRDTAFSSRFRFGYCHQPPCPGLLRRWTSLQFPFQIRILPRLTGNAIAVGDI